MDLATDKLMKDVKTVVGNAEDLLKATARQGGEQIDRIKDAGVDLDKSVRANPWTAVGVAAGIGLVLGDAFPVVLEAWSDLWSQVSVRASAH